MDQQAGAVLPAREAVFARPRRYPGLSGLPDANVRRAGSDAALFTAATYGAQLLLFVAGLLQKRLLGPTNSGYWALLSTFTVFFSLVSLGVVDGGSRQIPFHRGRGHREQAAAVANSAGSFGVLTNGLAGLAVIIVALTLGGSWSPEIRYGLVLLGLYAPLSELHDSHEQIMQSTKRFRVCSAAALVRAGIAVTITTLFVWAFGFYGMFLGSFATVLGMLFVWDRLGLTGLRKPAFRWSMDRTHLRELMRFGVPIMLQGQLWALFLVVDNLIVAGFLDVKQLGYYALACSATTYIMLLPKSIGAALTPRLSEHFGKNQDSSSIESYASNVQRVMSYLLLPAMVGAAFFLMPVLIRQGLPAFTPAIPVLRIMVAGSFFVALTTMPIKALLAEGHRWSVSNLTVLALVINGVANYVAVGVLHDGLTGAAYAVVISYFATFVILTMYALTRAGSTRRALGHTLELTCIWAYTAAAMWGIEKLFGPAGGSLVHDVLVSVGELALLLVALTPWLVLAQIRFGGLSALYGVARNLAGAGFKRRFSK